MNIIKPTMKKSHFNKDNEIVNTIETLDLYNKICQVKNFNDYPLILHHNVESLNNKLLDIGMMLTVDNLNVTILCFTEHWLLKDQMYVLSIDQFRLVSNFSSYSTSGGSCIFTRNTIQTKEVNYLSGLGSEKVFEMFVVELSDFGTILACICRSPDSDFIYFYVNWNY